MSQRFTKNLVIAGIHITMTSHFPLQITHVCEPFEEPEAEESDVTFFLHRSSRLPDNMGEMQVETERYRLYRSGRGTTLVKFLDIFKEKIGWYLCRDEADPRVYEVYLWGNDDCAMQTNPLSYTEISEFLIGYNAVVLHSSLVRLAGQGIVFTAPSGTGKSTQAELWRTYLGADVLNGDRSILRKMEGEYWAWGSPYAGSSGIYRNEKARLTALVVLRQAPFNRIRRLPPKRAYISILSETAISPLKKEIVEQQSRWLLELIEKVPVFLLECRPDEEAVTLLYQTLKENFHE